MEDDALDANAVGGILELGGDDPSVAAQLFAQFLAEAALRLDELEAALASGDLGSAARAAHTIRGSAASFGARRVVPLSLDLEAAAGGGDAARVGALTAALRVEFEAVRLAVGRVLASGDTDDARHLPLEAGDRRGPR